MEIKIRQVREQRKMSTTELAYRTSVSEAYISQIERGIKLPTLENLVCIADVLGCQLNDLIIIGVDDPTTATA